LLIKRLELNVFVSFSLQSEAALLGSAATKHAQFQLQDISALKGEFHFKWEDSMKDSFCFATFCCSNTKNKGE
jgi:hypothetical protein